MSEEWLARIQLSDISIFYPCLSVSIRGLKFFTSKFKQIQLFFS